MKKSYDKDVNCISYSLKNKKMSSGEKDSIISYSLSKKGVGKGGDGVNRPEGYQF